MVTVQTSTHTFHVSLGHRSDCNEYFRAMSQSSGQLAETLVSQCLLALSGVLTPDTCLSYLALARDICCTELETTVFFYLSRHLLELPHLTSMRKENLNSWNDPEAGRHLFTLDGSEVTGDWHPITELPFMADKWCFTAVILFNYLYLIGGYRQWAKRVWEFKMASFRFVVSFLPLTDFQFTLFLSHDLPLATSLGPCLYVLGNIQRTGEKLLLQYDSRQELWSELLPTLTKATVDLPSLYFLGTTDRLFVIGGNNSENVVAAFCVVSGQWGQVRQPPECYLDGQGTVLGDQVYMPGIEHSTAVMLDRHSLSLTVLPPLPICTRYEVLLQLSF
ncbi:uncharacterized protein LOC135573294 [Oncorhynchus nerka]|uniref:uncharacterized protein LOC135573294 n=1 Tax=Oncorhynchus nerka TaxID=8023 RepID=UPI0031B87C57